jgi:uncharacterized protein (TIGR03437 family)
MRTAWRVSGSILLIAFCAGTLRAQPFVFYRGFVNAASFAPPGLPNGSIARGSIFSIFGRDLGPAGSPPLAFPLQTTLGGVAVEVCQGGNCVPAIPLFVSPGQINAVMPSNAPLGGVSIRVTYNGQAGNFSPGTVAASSLGIFTVNSAGFGPGIVQNFLAQDNQPLNSAVATVRPGQVVTLWGTGLGPGLNADSAMPQAGDLPVAVEIFVGGKRVTNKLYSGRTPCCAGVDQIVFAIPSDTPSGCYVPVEVRTASQVVSNSITIAVNPAGQSCSDAHNPTGEVFRAGGKIGKVLLRRTHRRDDSGGQLVTAQADTALADFREETGGPWAFHTEYSLPPVGTCLVQERRGALIDTRPASGTLPSIRALDSGAELSFVGTQAVIPIQRRGNGFTGYYRLLAARVPGAEESAMVLEPGAAFQIRSAGGTDIGSWEVNLPGPPAPSWTNRDQVRQIQRSAGATITWEGGQLGGDNVWIWGGNADLTADAAVIFSCLASGESGSFTVPPHILTSVPATATRTSQTDGWLGVGRLSATAFRQFEASGLDSASAGTYSQFINTVQYR